MKRATLILAVAALPACLAAIGIPSSATASGPTPPGQAELAKGRTLLLVDDHDVLYRSGTRRVLHQPQRHPKNPLVGEVKPWEVAIGWTSIYRDPQTGTYQLWYQAHAGNAAQKKS